MRDVSLSFKEIKAFNLLEFGVERHKVCAPYLSETIAKALVNRPGVTKQDQATRACEDAISALSALKVETTEASCARE